MSTEVNSFRLNYRITNASADEVIVKVKGGLSYIIRRSKEATFQHERYLFVTIENVLLDNLKVDDTQALTKLDRKILKEIHEEQLRIQTRTAEYFKTLPNDINVRIRLTEDLVERNNAIHSELLGITLYCGGENIHQPCLNTPGQTFRELFDDQNEHEEVKASGGLHYFVYINDPQRITKPLYTNVLGKAVEVPVVMDPKRQPGLYIGLSLGIEPRETLYYTFESMGPKTLEAVGLFQSKQECQEGGNTERYVTAENKNRELTKDNGRLKDQLESTNALLLKADVSMANLVGELTQLKNDHKNEIKQLKMEHNFELTNARNQSKITSDMFKFESRIKDATNKANLDYVKQKSDHNNWGEFAKAIGALAGVAFTGYKLLVG